MDGGGIEDGAKSPRMAAPAPARRASMSRSLLRAANQRGEDESVSVEAVLASLGDRSFSWAILVFALVNLIPAPLGSTLVTAVPLLIVTAQMALGAHHLWLPRVIARRRVSRKALKRAVIRLRPLIRPIERTLKPRRLWLFTARNERIVGAMLFAVSVALFTPLPLTGAFPAWSLVVSALALLDRDGTVLLAGLTAGAASIAVTVAVVAAVLAGVESFFV